MRFTKSSHGEYNFQGPDRAYCTYRYRTRDGWCLLAEQDKVRADGSYFGQAWDKVGTFPTRAAAAAAAVERDQQAIRARMAARVEAAQVLNAPPDYEQQVRDAVAVALDMSLPAEVALDRIRRIIGAVR